MDKTTLILSSLTTVALAFIIAPGVIAMNRGKMLRNIAAWLAIFLLLGIFYNNFGPGRNTGINTTTEKSAPAPEAPSEDDGFTPPGE